MNTFDPGRMVAIDTETTGLFAYQGDVPFAVSMANENGETWYCEWQLDPYTRRLVSARKDQGDSRHLSTAADVLWRGTYPRRKPSSGREMIEADMKFDEDVAFIRSVMEDTSITKVFHNGKFDVRMLDVSFGIKLKGRVEETLFAARACDSDEANYRLKDLCTKYLDIGREDNDELLNIVKYLRPIAKAAGYSIAETAYQDYWLPRFYASVEYDIDPYWNLCQTYAELDAVRTMMLWKMYEQAMEYEGVRKVYDLEISLWQCTYDMETRGVVVNTDICLREQVRHRQTVIDSTAKMKEMAGYDFNPRSTKQLLRVCEERKLQPTEKTSKGQPSMSFNSIRTLTDDPFVHQLQRFRASEKVDKTFLEKYLFFAVPDWHPGNPTGKCLHPMFNQAGAQTGRYSCSHPNLQQVVNANGARNAVEAMSARMAFGPRPGYVWYHIDYSQLELYLFASMAREEFMLHHIMSGHDMHTECANKAWGGNGNPNALIKGAVALECEADRPTTQYVQKMWDEFGWNPKHALDKRAKDEFTAWWLSKYGGDDWNIVKAEKALGKKVARTRAKFVMYAKIYGGGPEAIRNFLYCTPAEAKEFQLEYDTAFPRIKAYLNELMQETRGKGYVQNPYGRKVKIPSEFAYKCVNFLIQGCAADLLKDSMRKTYAFVHEFMDDWHLLLTIHDELVFEVPAETPEQSGMIYKTKTGGDGTVNPYYDVIDWNTPTVYALQEIKRLMEDHEGRFSVPTPVELARCDERWDVKINVEI